MKDLVFLDWDELLAAHKSQLELYGGQDGFVDDGVVRSAVARAQFTAQYVEDADLADLAAEYFFDWRRRRGSLMETSVRHLQRHRSSSENNWQMTITDELMYILAMGVATGTVDKETLARILRDHMEEIDDS